MYYKSIYLSLDTGEREDEICLNCIKSEKFTCKEFLKMVSEYLVDVDEEFENSVHYYVLISGTNMKIIMINTELFIIDGSDSYDPVYQITDPENMFVDYKII
jgi:hypothetical protein